MVVYPVIYEIWRWHFWLKRELVPAATNQLATELIFVHLLITDQMKANTKRDLISTVLSWSPTPISVPSDLAKALDGGLCNAGQGFLSFRPFLLMFLVRFVQRWKHVGADAAFPSMARCWPC